MAKRNILQNLLPRMVFAGMMVPVLFQPQPVSARHAQSPEAGEPDTAGCLARSKQIAERQKRALHPANKTNPNLAKVLPDETERIAAIDKAAYLRDQDCLLEESIWNKTREQSIAARLAKQHAENMELYKRYRSQGAVSTVPASPDRNHTPHWGYVQYQPIYLDDNHPNEGDEHTLFVSQVIDASLLQAPSDRASFVETLSHHLAHGYGIQGYGGAEDPELLTYYHLDVTATEWFARRLETELGIKMTRRNDLSNGGFQYARLTLVLHDWRCQERKCPEFPTREAAETYRRATMHPAENSYIQHVVEIR